MTSSFLQTFAALLAERDIRVTRFNFPYMAAFQADGKRRPPPRVERLSSDYLDLIGKISAQRGADVALFIGGKSMGGRIASMIADEAAHQFNVAGCVCLGYPFHPKGRPNKLRTDHLERLKTPTLIVQGERDALGTKDDVASYTLSSAIDVVWAQDGDHDLKPRKQSGVSLADNLTFAADATARLIASGGKS